jgi:uncharacterized membrane protein YciS (DUF1049 family)
MRYNYIALVLVITILIGAIDFEGLQHITLNSNFTQVTLPVPTLLLFIYFIGLFAGTLVCTVVSYLHEPSPATSPKIENGLN